MIRLKIFSVSFYVILLAVTLFIVSCAKNLVKESNTLIIIDPYSVSEYIKKEENLKKLRELLANEINLKFMENRKSNEKILVVFGESEKNRITIGLNNYLRRLNFYKYDKELKNYIEEKFSLIINTIKQESYKDQSNYFGVFGEYYFATQQKIEYSKIILVGNLIEKEFHNLSILRYDIDNMEDTQKVYKEIEKRLSALKEKFENKYSAYNPKNKIEIILYPIRSKVEEQVYVEKIYYLHYLKHLESILVVYDKSRVIEYYEDII